MIKDQVRVSLQFQKQARKAIFAIGVFISVYLIIFLLAIGLTVACVYGGILIISTFTRVIGIAFGIGLASLGFLVLFFLIKFIFSSNKTDRSHLLRITESEEPEIFRLIREIVEKVGTKFPKNVYLSADVNAAVFYDSNFWSMFFPVKKNLQIGLGLVNATYRDELKAVLSHEFGHFSQSSMKVGSYVYNTNQVIYNMLYDNDGYYNAVGSWARASGYFSIFVVIAIKIIQGIQWLLQQMYRFVNKNYLGLSREMEFHADEIAANVTGYLPLQNSLLRFDMASQSLDTVYSFYDSKVSENIRSSNVFKEQTYVFLQKTTEDGIPVENGVPMVSLEHSQKFQKSKLKIEDQWASHPSNEMRIKNLKENCKPGNPNTLENANTYFNDIEKRQRQLTDLIFSKVNYQHTPEKLSFESFKISFEEYSLRHRFAPVYNGYYDDKDIEYLDLDNIESSTNNISLKTLFSDYNVDLVYSYNALENDIANIQQITERKVRIKTFDYAGVKYHQKRSASLLDDLRKEKEVMKTAICRNDENIYRFFLKQEISGNSKLKEFYKDYYQAVANCDSKLEIYTTMMDRLGFIHTTSSIEDINRNFQELKGWEFRLKGAIKEIAQDPLYDLELNQEMKDNFNLYVERELEYFGRESYREKNLEVLFRAINDYGYLTTKGQFLQKKKLLDYQASLIH